MNAIDYWKENKGLRHITPAGIEWPEGFYFPEWVKERFDGYSRVVDLGCGYGRLARCFYEDCYIGIDINPTAFRAAGELNPRHEFAFLEDGDRVGGDVVFCHTVCLHIPDDEIAAFLGRIVADEVVISEIMGLEYRVPEQTDPPVFNRDADTYTDIMHALGYSQDNLVTIPYERYKGANLTVLSFTRDS